MDYHSKELTKEEMEKIEEATKNIGQYGTVEIIKNGSTIDLIESKRIRIRNGKHSSYHKG